MRAISVIPRTSRRVASVGLLSLLLGGGELNPKLRAELEAEGLVLVEEKLRGSIRYSHFKAPGKRFHGKIVPLRLALGISERRLVIYGGWASSELVDSPFDSPRFRAVDIELEDPERIVLRVDYSRMDEAEAAGVSGEVTIRMRTANAASIAEQIRARTGGSRL
jgi:hypothetical protein